jgi:hypothetical protein
MMQELRSGKNPPLEKLLEEHTEVSESAEDSNAHYTFVDLHKIATDAEELPWCFELSELRPST